MHKQAHNLLRPRKHKEEQSHQDGEEQHERPPPPPSQRRRIRQHSHNRLHDQARQRRRDPDERSLALGQTQSQKVGFEVCAGIVLDRRGEKVILCAAGDGGCDKIVEKEQRTGKGKGKELQVISTAQVNLHHIINIITDLEIKGHLLKPNQRKGQHSHALKVGVTFNPSLPGPGGLRSHGHQRV